MQQYHSLLHHDEIFKDAQPFTNSYEIFANLFSSGANLLAMKYATSFAKYALGLWV